VITKKRLREFKDLYYGEMKVANDLRFKLALSEFQAQKLETILRVEYPNLNLDFARPEDFKERVQE
jgi:hypothetical protein